MFEPMFVPPRDSPLLHATASALLPWLAPIFGKGHSVSVPAADLDRLRALKGRRALLCPNHPSESDPIALFWLGKLVGERFNYVATRETFDTLRGKLVNWLGAYSVIRGFPDRESLRMTRRLLTELNRKVVIFPEGNIYEMNDRMLEFQTGVVQIGFWALDDLKKGGEQPELPLVPIALRYRCLADPTRAIERSLAELEAAMQLPPPGPLGLSNYDRLMRLGGEVLNRIEREEQVTPSPDADLDERIDNARGRILRRVAAVIGEEIDTKQGPAQQLHDTFAALKAWVGVHSGDGDAYDERRYHHRLTIAAPLFKDLSRLQNFIAVTSDYVALRPTAERFLEVLTCLQTEVFGAARHYVPLGVELRIAEPIPLEERHAAYREQKRETVSAATRELQSRVRQALDGMADLCTFL